MSVEAPAAPAKLSPAETYRRYMRRIWADPVGWINQMFGVELWTKQQEVIEALRDNPRVAVPSCNAAGKSFLAACIAHWYLASVAPGRVVLTGASWTGIEHIVWPWVKRLHGMALEPLGGVLMESVEWDRGIAGGLIGVAATDAERISGFRSEHGVLVIVDESSALSQEVHNAIIGLSASEGSRVLYIGNPLRTVGPFQDVCKPNSGWHVIPIGAFDVPNVITGRNIIPGLATRQWVEDCKREWGEDSAEYSARVLGKFPETGMNSVFSGRILDQVEREHCRAPAAAGMLAFESDRETCRVRGAQFIADQRGPLSVWQMPDKSRNYAIGADIGQGLDASNSVLAVVDVQTREVVAEFTSNRYTPEELASQASALAQFYGGQLGVAYTAWESNNAGVFGKRLLAIGHRYVHWSQDELSASPNRSRVPGWNSNPASKLALLGDMRGAMARGEFVPHGKQFIAECREYIFSPAWVPMPAKSVDKPEGERKAHGDRVIAYAVAWLAAKHQPLASFASADPPASSMESRRREWKRKQNSNGGWE